MLDALRVLGLSVVLLAAATPAFTNDDVEVPPYKHIFVIMDENKNYATILDPATAPNFSTLAKTYGNATNFFAEAHPSEPNYIALVSGDTFGVTDDGYHTFDAPNLAQQLTNAEVPWKGYYESIPTPGSEDARAGLYAFKHSGFMNFASVRNDPDRALHIVGFDQLDSDLESGTLPSFALIVPNLCNDMHGATSCPDAAELIRRGDAVIGDLVRKIQSTDAWKSADNVAIVITFDESENKTEPGGGHIPTIVITNHGPRHKSDGTAYTHYALLRTIEDAFGIRQYLGRAAQSQPMAPLFATH
ncbi:MAG TPA: alkaline phosphatase family protein [Candidatus Aquilonibacter sp.]